MELKLVNEEEGKKVNVHEPGDMENPWERELHSEPVQISATAHAEDLYTTEYKAANDHTLLRIMKAILYTGLVLEVVLCIWCCLDGGVHVYSNLQKVSWVFTAVNAICIIDAVFVFFIGKSKWSLFIWAWLLPFLYPMKRKKHLEGRSGMATLICVAVLVGYAAVFTQLGIAIQTYGNVLMTDDEATRTAVGELYEQAGTDNVKLGTRIAENMQADTASLLTHDDQMYLVLIGSGKQSLDDAGKLVQSGEKVNPTSLTFMKNASGYYELVSAILISRQMDEKQVKNYEEQVLHN